MIYKAIEWLCGGSEPFTEEGGGLWECCICQLVIEENNFLILSHERCGEGKGYVY